MKILLFTDSLGAGGAQRQLVGLAVILHNLGYDVKVCTYHNIDFYKKYLDENNVKNELIFGADNIKKRIWIIRNYFKKEKPDWVIAYQETPSVIACISRILGCKYKLIVSERNTSQFLGIREKIRFLLYKWADSIVPNSYSQESFLLTNYPWMKNKLTTISNYVDLNRFTYTPKVKAESCKIIVAATIWPSKNVKGLIEAIRILAQKKLRFKIEWYGINEAYKTYLNECIELIEKYNLNEYIVLLPKTKEIHEKYIDCDYFCLPSFYEGTPNVICEAMACGRPILCSNVCDNPIYVEENCNGFLFDPHNPISIAMNIQEALELDDENYQQMCKCSRNRADSLLSEKLFISKYLTILK